ncbi:hypothetical protein ScPMuIL_007025 [Solemya velum]
MDAPRMFTMLERGHRTGGDPRSHTLMAAVGAFLWSLVCRNYTNATEETPRFPPVRHLVLEPEDIREKAVFVIGDIHGCLDELLELVEKARRTEQGREILFLFVGDLINKGPKNAEVVKYIRELKGLSVRGNNDESLIDELRGDRSNLSSKYGWVAEMADEDIDYLLKMPYTISIPSINSMIVHAGIIPGRPLHAQSITDMVHMRNIIEEDYFHGSGLRGDRHVTEGVAWASLWPGPEHIYFGHDARRGLQFHPKATGLDTGCVYGKELTGVFINYSKKLISLKAHKVHKDTTLKKIKNNVKRNKGNQNNV